MNANNQNKFAFTAKSIDGKVVSGFVNAATKEYATKMLMEKDMEVISILSEKELAAKENFVQKDITEFINFGGMFESVGMKDMVNFSKQMAALLDAGVSVIKALQLINEEEKNPLMKKVLDDVVQDVKSGKSISTAFGKHKEVFTDFYVNLIRSGEESGKMSQSFFYLSDYLDRNYALVSKVRNAMIYPAFVITIFFIVMILIFTLVIPQLATILKESNMELPLLTQIVLSISDFLVNYGIYAFLLIGTLGVYSYVNFRNSQDFKDLLDGLKINFPIIKNVFRMLYVTRIADNIQTLITSGVSLTKSIQITGEVVGNKYYKEVMEAALLDVKAGISFSKSLEKHKDLIPSSLIQMLRIGEETGEIGKLMGNIAKFFQREINAQIDVLVGLIEPIMIVALGLGVGVLLVSVLLPIYNLAGSF